MHIQDSPSTLRGMSDLDLTCPGIRAIKIKEGLMSPQSEKQARKDPSAATVLQWAKLLGVKGEPQLTNSASSRRCEGTGTADLSFS